jgi:Lrp/AsnC family transcriptional regulator for asnA, asnC and gidA
VTREPRAETRDARGPQAEDVEIDLLNAGIIEALQENGRESFRSIAERLGVSEATIRTRYARMRAAGVLHVTAITDPLGLGFDVMSMVGVRTDGDAGSVASEIAGWREISYVALTAGRFDLLVEVVCEDREAFLRITSRLRALAGVRETESFMYLRLEKQKYDWGTKVDPGDPAPPAA